MRLLISSAVWRGTRLRVLGMRVPPASTIGTGAGWFGAHGEKPRHPGIPVKKSRLAALSQEPAPALPCCLDDLLSCPPFPPPPKDSGWKPRPFAGAFSFRNPHITNDSGEIPRGQ